MHYVCTLCGIPLVLTVNLYTFSNILYYTMMLIKFNKARLTCKLVFLAHGDLDMFFRSCRPSLHGWRHIAPWYIVKVITVLGASGVVFAFVTITHSIKFFINRVAIPITIVNVVRQVIRTRYIWSSTFIPHSTFCRLYCEHCICRDNIPHTKILPLPYPKTLPLPLSLITWTYGF